MKICFSTLCCLDYSLEQISALARRCGMDGVELRVDDGMLENIDVTSPVFDELPKYGIKLTDIASSIWISDSFISENAEKYVDLAAAIGCPAVRVFANSRLGDPRTRAEHIRGIAENLKKLCVYAGDKGVEIWLENHSEISPLATCREITDTVQMPNLKVLWDVLHSIEYGEDVKTSAAILGDCIAHVHLKDGVPPVDDGKIEYTHTDLGLGTFPFAEVISVLRSIRYDGYLSLEWESPWCPEIRDLYDDPVELLNNYKKILISSGVTI